MTQTVYISFLICYLEFSIFPLHTSFYSSAAFEMNKVTADNIRFALDKWKSMINIVRLILNNLYLFLKHFKILKTIKIRKVEV